MAESNNHVGPTIGVDLRVLRTGVKELKSDIKTIESTFRSSVAGIKDWDTNATHLEKRISTLSEEVEKQREIVKRYNDELDKMKKLHPENKEEIRKLTQEMNGNNSVLKKQEASLEAYKNQLDSITTVSGRLHSAFGRFNNFLKDSLKFTIGRIIYDAFVKLGEAITGVFEAGREFESAFTGVIKTVDATDSEIQKLERDIKQLAMSVPESTTEIAKVAEEAGQLGIATENIMAFTETMVRLGDSTNLSSEEAAEALAKFANVTEMNAQNYERLGSTIVELGNNFATTERDIVNMATRISSVGTQIGMSEDEIVSWSTAISALGVKTELGGTAISRVMSDMQLAVGLAGNELRLFAETAGMTAEEFGNLFREDSSEALRLFFNGLSRIQEEGGNLIVTLEKLGLTNVRIRDTVLRLANGNELLNESLEMGKKAWQENDALMRESSLRYETVESKLEMMNNAWNNVSLQIYNAFEPAYRDVLDWSTKIAKALTGNVTAGEDLNSSLIDLVGNLESYKKAQEQAKKATDDHTQAMLLQASQATRMSVFEVAENYSNAIDLLHEYEQEQKNLVKDNEVNIERMKAFASGLGLSYEEFITRLTRGEQFSFESVGGYDEFQKGYLKYLEETGTEGAKVLLDAFNKMYGNRAESFGMALNSLNRGKGGLEAISEFNLAFETLNESIGKTNEELNNARIYILEAFRNGVVEANDFLATNSELSDLLRDNGDLYGRAYESMLDVGKDWSIEQLNSYLLKAQQTADAIVDKTSAGYARQLGYIQGIQTILNNRNDGGGTAGNEGDLFDPQGVWDDTVKQEKVLRDYAELMGQTEEELNKSLRSLWEKTAMTMLEGGLETTDTFVEDVMEKLRAIPQALGEVEVDELAEILRNATNTVTGNNVYGNLMGTDQLDIAKQNLSAWENALKQALEANNYNTDDSVIQTILYQIEQLKKETQETEAFDWSKLVESLQTELNYLSEFSEGLVGIMDNVWQTELNAIEARLEEIDDLVEDTVNSANREANKQIAELNAMYEAGAISQEEYLANVAEAQAEAKIKEIKAEEEAEAEKEKLQAEADALKKKQFEADKQNSIAQVWIDLASSIMRLYTTMDVLTASVMTGVLTALAGAQTASISSQQYVSAYAKGGVIDKPTLALMGEAGKEAVLPLEHNTEWIGELAGQLNRAMQGGNTVNDNTSVSNSNVTNFNQTINSPRALSRREIYRDTRKMLKQFGR